MRYLLGFFLALPVFALSSQEDIVLGPNSQSYANIAKGTVTQHQWSSTIYAGTIRDYYVYVPAQYDGVFPAALMIFQDGHTYIKADGNFRVPTVFDNLIAQGKMPMTIGLFINPGHNKELPAPESPWRSRNRSIEYDSLSDTYTRFLMEEMIPELKKAYILSDDPKMRAICGISSGGICAFTAAWSRPDVFHKVLSHIGSFTDIRGGHNYPPIIRQSEVKPIKVFLQDGTNDLDNKFGNWFLANQQMAKALAFKNYDFHFATDSGAHNGQNAGLILPQSLTWLWSDVVPKRLASQKYTTPEVGSGSSNLFAGETTHLAQISCDHLYLKKEQKATFSSSEEEQVIIIRSGIAEVQIGNEIKALSPNSVIMVEMDEEVSMTSQSENLQYLKISLRARTGNHSDDEQEEHGSFFVDFDELEFKANARGGRRDFFRRATEMFPYFEMHMTTLNQGFRSHLPHTHKAEELIIMVEGETEEEIGNAEYLGGAGDIYYLGADVPHGIKNMGNGPCTYFAFQWSLEQRR